MPMSFGPSLSAVPCQLFEPDGQLLSAGLWVRAADEPADLLWVTAFDRPGRIVQRCLLGEVRTVWLRCDDGSILTAQVCEVRFDPAHGRMCLLQRSSETLPTPSPVRIAIAV